MTKCGECKHNKVDWTNPQNPDYYCGNEEGEYYGCPTAYDDGCEEGEEKNDYTEGNVRDR